MRIELVTVEENQEEQQAAHLVAELWSRGHLRLGNFLMLLGGMIAEKCQASVLVVVNKQPGHRTGLLLLDMGEVVVKWERGMEMAQNTKQQVLDAIRRRSRPPVK